MDGAHRHPFVIYVGPHNDELCRTSWGSARADPPLSNMRGVPALTAWQPTDSRHYSPFLSPLLAVFVLPGPPEMATTALPLPLLAQATEFLCFFAVRVPGTSFPSNIASVSTSSLMSRSYLMGLTGILTNVFAYRWKFSGQSNVRLRPTLAAYLTCAFFFFLLCIRLLGNSFS